MKRRTVITTEEFDTDGHLKTRIVEETEEDGEYKDIYPYIPTYPIYPTYQDRIDTK